MNGFIYKVGKNQYQNDLVQVPFSPSFYLYRRIITAMSIDHSSSYPKKVFWGYLFDPKL